ncbi:MAG: GDP-L-fucose synthase [Saprospiraceae bacterium]|nr:GDP-L-fucose synthase [Saprospiraceae bacterium]
MNIQDKIYVAGHTGMVGSALVRHLQKMGFENIVYRTSSALDLRDQSAVDAFFSSEKPAYVFLAAGKVGGVHANNTYRAEFIYDNIMMEANIIHAAHQHKVNKLLFFGSSCIYPKMAPQPLKEEYLLSSPLEPTNEPYSIAKITGIKLCEAHWSQYGDHFFSVMPTNLYGPNDNYDLQNSHVLPALLRKFHEAKRDSQPTVTMWGSGSPMREFMHVDDLADASIFLMQRYDKPGFVNIGSGQEVSIKALAELIGDIVGYQGEIIHDTTKPDGTPRKLLDSSILHNMGWYPKVTLREGIEQVYEECRDLEWY